MSWWVFMRIRIQDPKKVHTVPTTPAPGLKLKRIFYQKNYKYLPQSLQQFLRWCWQPSCPASQGWKRGSTARHVFLLPVPPVSLEAKSFKNTYRYARESGAKVEYIDEKGVSVFTWDNFRGVSIMLSLVRLPCLRGGTEDHAISFAGNPLSRSAVIFMTCL